MEIIFTNGSTRIMVYKGMVYKGKYSISEKNKGTLELQLEEVCGI